MLLQTLSLFLSLLSTTAFALPSTELSKRQNNNFYAGVCYFYWVANRAENTPMDLQVYDAYDQSLFHDTTTLLPSWSNNEAYVLVYEMDRWIGIQSQDHNLPAMFAYGSNTRISLDPNQLVQIDQPLGNYHDSPPPGQCAWTLPTDHLHPTPQPNTNFMKCAFNCGQGY